MLIPYVALGIISGVFAAFAALFVGSGVLVVLAAYVFGGVAGMVTGMLALLARPQSDTAFDGALRRSDC